MRVNFRQGIVSHESPDPFVLSGSNVDIIASNRPTTVTIAHRGTDYIHSENSSVTSAWTVVLGTDYWLYWDFNLLTFARTFGTTTLAPIAQAAEPSSPANGQMWYDTANHVHYERSGGTWVEVLRVFAAKVIDSALLGVAATGSSNWAGTQINDTSSVLAGRVLFDEASDTIIRDDGTLFTTEDQFFSSQSRVDAIRLESNVSRALSLDSLIAAFTVVAWKADGKVSAAEYDDVGSTVVGMLTEQIQHAGSGSPVLTASEQGAIITQGTITNSLWDWSASIGLPLWVDNGLLTVTDPHLNDPITYSVGQVPVARVLSIDTIIFEQGLGGKGDRGVAGPTGPAIAATTTTLGSVALSVTPPDANIEAPVVVETNDSRLSDARTPLTHLHAEYVEIVGDTMTGLLILSGDPVTNLGAATKQYVDTEISGIVHPDPAVTLNDLTDVIVAGSPLVADQVLTFDGTNWVNATGGTIVVDDTSPQLGGALDVNGNAIVSTAAADIAITPDTTGSIILDGLSWPTADGTADYVLKTDGAGTLSWAASSTTLSDDVSPTLGAALDLNGYALTSASTTGLTIDTGADVPDSGYNLGGITTTVNSWTVNPNINASGMIHITDDGTTLYWVDGNGTGIEVYTSILSTPHDITTAGVGSVITVTGGSNNGGAGITLNPTGTVMLIQKSGGIISEFTLSTPFDVSSFVYVDDSIIFDAGGLFSVIGDTVYFSKDGLHAIQGGRGTDRYIAQYTLGVAWDISTATYIQAKNINAQEPTGTNVQVSMSADGTKMYSGHFDGGADQELNYYIAATPFDVSTATFDSKITMPDGSAFSESYFWNTTGTSLYYFESNGDIYQYDTSVGDGGTGGVSTSLYYNDVVKLTTTATGVDIADLSIVSTVDSDTIDSTKDLFALEINGISGAAVTYELPQGFDTATLTYDTKSTPVDTDAQAAPWFSPDGVYMFYIRRALVNTSVYRKTLGTPWDISTAGSEVSQGINDVSDTVTGLWISSDGLILWIFTTSAVQQWTFGTAWDISTLPAAPAASASNIWSGNSGFGVYQTPDGINSYMADSAPEEVIWNISSTPGDVTSIAPGSIQDLTGYNPKSISVNNDGSKMFVLADDEVHEFALSVAYDPTSLTFVNTVTLANLFGQLTDNATWDVNGTQYYIFDNASNLVTQYSSNASGGGTRFVGYHNDTVKVKTTTTGVTVSGDLTVSGVITESATTYGTTGAVSLDLSAGTFFYPTGTTTGAITFTFDTPAATGVTAFTLKMEGAGDFAPVWPAGVDWPAATEPTWTAGGIDFVSFITHDGGTTWYGMLGGLAFA